MRSVVVTAVLGLVLGWCGSSCVENEPPPAQKPVTILSPPVTAQPAQVKSNKAAEKKEARAERQADQKQVVRASAVAPQVPPGAPPAPKGAQYTIFCGRLQGDAHVERSNKIKTDLMAKTGLRDFYVVHEDGQSLLYYGYYRTFNDPADKKETSRAQADLKRLKTMEMDGSRVFAGAVFVDLEAPDPQAPPEWNLVNAKGTWSLQIAAYKDSPLRKEAAVEAVREARKLGIEAYYYHGESVSSVCVGAWPEGAIRYTSPHQDVHKPVIVNQPVISEPNQRVETAADEIRASAHRANAEVVQGKVEVIDPTLLATMKQYPNHAVNGMQMMKTVEGKQMPDPSLLIRIPSPAQGNSLLTSAPPGGANQLQPRAYPDQQSPQPQPQPDVRPVTRKPAPPPPQQPGLGKLKSIDG